MKITTTPQVLVGFPVPCLFQEYINHGAVVYKVYELGNQLEVTCRTSTRDIKEGESFTLEFNSQNSGDKKRTMRSHSGSRTC